MKSPDVKALLPVPEYWRSLEVPKLEAFLYGTAVSFSEWYDDSTFPQVAALYEHCLEKLDSDSRRHVLATVEQRITREPSIFRSLGPFILFDPDPGIVSTAVLSYTMRRPIQSDPLEAVRQVIRWIIDDALESPGGAFGALVLLGDGRVNALLIEARSHLSDEDVRIAANCWSGFATTAQVEFWPGLA